MKNTSIGAALVALLFGAGCTSNVTTFVRSVDFARDGSGALLVTRCTLTQEYWGKAVDVDGPTCTVETKKPVKP